MRLGIWPMATTRISFWTWIWSVNHCGLGRKWLVDLLKISICFFWLAVSLFSLVLLMWKWVCLFLRKNHLLRCWSWLFVLNWIGALTLPLLLKLPPRKSELWFILWSFFLLMLLYISTNLPFSHAWNTAVMPWLVLLVTNWNCWRSYKNGYARLLVVQLLPLLSPWLTIGRSIAASLEPLAHHWIVSNWSHL